VRFFFFFCYSVVFFFFFFCEFLSAARYVEVSVVFLFSAVFAFSGRRSALRSLHARALPQKIDCNWLETVLQSKRFRNFSLLLKQARIHGFSEGSVKRIQKGG